MSIIKTASLHRYDILKFRNDLCRKEVSKGKNIAPFYYIIPQKQKDESELVNLINLLMEHGIKVFYIDRDVSFNNRMFNKGDLVVPLSQPFRPFIKEVMEKQSFPERHYTPGGKLIKPYDITSWSLPLHRGINSIEINKKGSIPIGFESYLKQLKNPFKIISPAQSDFFAAVFPVNRNESFKAIFSALQNGMKVFRLKKVHSYDGGELQKGSFVIYKNKQSQKKLSKILDGLNVSPRYISKSVLFETNLIKIPRIALIETYFHDMDSGWTRYVLDSYKIPFKILHPGELSRTDLQKNYDVIIIPDTDKNILMKGKRFSKGNYYAGNYPPEFSKGFGKKGFNRLLLFLNNGGIVISWRRSTALFMGPLELDFGKSKKESFTLPVSDISDSLKKQGLYCPGSFMKISLKKGHPVTLGLPGEIGVFYRGNPVFRTRVPSFDMDRRVLGTFPEKNILISGYCENEKLIGNRAVITWIKKNRGQLILMGFNPQFRASTQVTYKLLFNSLFL